MSSDNFFDFYQEILCMIINDLPNDVAQRAKEWFTKNINHNLPGGKLNRGKSVYDTFFIIKGSEPTEEEKKDCYLCGWCIELLQAFFLVADDLMDGSITRRGHPCWYRMPGINLIAINDSILLEGCLYRLLKKRFRGKAHYLQILELFLDTAYLTEIGQLHDLITAPTNGETIDWSRYTLENYKLIVKYKTAYYSFYLPVSCAMVLAGFGEESKLRVAENILLEIGEYFQIQDDYLDCYGSPEVIGKIGTDIQEAKCGWLVIQAISKCNNEQLQILHSNYGKNDEKSVSIVKDLYNQLSIEKCYLDYEERVYKKLNEMIEGSKQVINPKIFTAFLGKIYKRSK